MEVISALVLFIGLIVSWLLLPGSTSAATAEPIATASTATATQPA